MQYIVYTAQYPVCSIVFHSKRSHGLRDESSSDTQSRLSFAPREREMSHLIPRGTTTSALLCSRPTSQQLKPSKNTNTKEPLYSLSHEERKDDSSSCWGCEQERDLGRSKSLWLRRSAGRQMLLLQNKHSYLDRTRSFTSPIKSKLNKPQEQLKDV